MYSIWPHSKMVTVVAPFLLAAGVRRGAGVLQRGRAALQRSAHHLHHPRGPHLRDLPQRVHQAAPPRGPLRQAQALLRRQVDAHLGDLIRLL